jgi:hypothetical protein
MMEVMADEEQKQRWRALAQGGAPDWDRLFYGYSSCVDWPSAHYWRELVRYYPQARVILTYRSPESWWESFEKTILAGINESTDPESLGLALISKQVFGGRPQDRAHAIAVYEANVEAVRATVPEERLLVHELGDGWAPLCAHLGVPAETAPAILRRPSSTDTDCGAAALPACRVSAERLFLTGN